MSDDTYREMLALLNRLEEAKIAHRLAKHRDDAIMIEVDVPGERWEIEFVDYGDEVHVEIERFRSNGVMYDEKVLDKLFAFYSADSPELSPDQVRHESEVFFHGEPSDVEKQAH
jgi:hypothetical protein